MEQSTLHYYAGKSLDDVEIDSNYLPINREVISEVSDFEDNGSNSTSKQTFSIKVRRLRKTATPIYFGLTNINR